MKILAIDTSDKAGSVALAVDGKVTTEEFLTLDEPTAVGLVDAIDRVLAGAGYRLDDLDGLGLTVGPGSFTGLRIGLAVMKGIAYAQSKPLIPFSSLEVLVNNRCVARRSPLVARKDESRVTSHESQGVCVAIIDAHRGEVYALVKRGGDEELLPECVITPEVLLEKLTKMEGPIFFSGSGALKYRDLLTKNRSRIQFSDNEKDDFPRASTVAILAALKLQSGETSDLNNIHPTYLRRFA